MTSGSQATTPLPLVRSEELIQVSEHVYVIPDGNVRGVPNVGIVVGSEATLVIDTGMGPRNGEIVLAAARSVCGDAPLQLMTTHVHPEHDLGAQVFPADTVFIRARSQVAEIDEFGMQVANDFRAASAAFAELLVGAEFRTADVVFDDTYEVDLGDVHVRLTAMGANHTPGDTIALVVEDRVLFSGDVAMKNTPAFASPRSSLNRWLDSLDVLDALDAGLIVPSHGPLGDKGMIAGYRTYLTGVRDRTAALRTAGSTVDEAVDALVPEFVGQYPDEARIAGAVRSTYAEAAATA